MAEAKAPEVPMLDVPLKMAPLVPSAEVMLLKEKSTPPAEATHAFVLRPELAFHQYSGVGADGVHPYEMDGVTVGVGVILTDGLHPNDADGVSLGVMDGVTLGVVVKVGVTLGVTEGGIGKTFGSSDTGTENGAV